MCPFDIGDYVKNKCNSLSPVMIVAVVRLETDYSIWQKEARLEARLFPIGCRWWDEDTSEFMFEWFSLDELEIVKVGLE